jgi:hypothetical protein
LIDKENLDEEVKRREGLSTSKISNQEEYQHQKRVPPPCFPALIKLQLFCNPIQRTFFYRE